MTCNKANRNTCGNAGDGSTHLAGDCSSSDELARKSPAWSAPRELVVGAELAPHAAALVQQPCRRQLQGQPHQLW